MQLDVSCMATCFVDSLHAAGPPQVCCAGCGHGHASRRNCIAGSAAPSALANVRRMADNFSGDVCRTRTGGDSRGLATLVARVAHTACVQILSQIGAPPIERWPTTVVERDRVVGELEEATSEAAMASVWAGSEAESEALGRIEWLLAPGEVNWVEQTPANPGRITEFTSELRRGKLLEIWVQIHR